MSAGNSVESLLFMRARDHLTDEELERIADDTSDVGELADSAAAVANGIACLVLTDGEEPSKAGNFQNADELPALLSHFADVFRRIAVQDWLHDMASATLHQRRADRC